MRLLAILGEPATGKSTLVRKIIEHLGKGWTFKQGLFFGTVFPSKKVIVLGSYAPGEKFPGTDRMSMAVIKDLSWFKGWVTWRHPDFTVLFEGDRLAIESFLTAWPERTIYFLEVPEAILGGRHVARADSQTETFLRSRRTKLANLEKKTGPFTLRQNSSEAHQVALCEEILERLGTSR